MHKAPKIPRQNHTLISPIRTCPPESPSQVELLRGLGAWCSYPEITLWGTLAQASGPYNRPLQVAAGTPLGEEIFLVVLVYKRVLFGVWG